MSIPFFVFLSAPGDLRSARGKSRLPADGPAWRTCCSAGGQNKKPILHPKNRLQVRLVNGFLMATGYPDGHHRDPVALCPILTNGLPFSSICFFYPKYTIRFLFLSSCSQARAQRPIRTPALISFTVGFNTIGQSEDFHLKAFIFFSKDPQIIPQFRFFIFKFHGFARIAGLDR